MLTKIRKIRANLPMCNWREYVGCECDAIIYVSGDGATVLGNAGIVSMAVGGPVAAVSVVYAVGGGVSVGVVFAGAILLAICSGGVGGGGFAGVAGAVIVGGAVALGAGTGVVGGIGGAVFGGVVGGFVSGFFGSVVSFVGATVVKLQVRSSVQVKVHSEVQL